jgi:ABC-2 type transport system permease protein
MRTSLRKTTALLIKDLRDAFKNPTILFCCLLPVLFVFAQNEMARGRGDAATTIAFLLPDALCLSAGTIGAMAALYSVAEEKEKHTLRTLMLANVRAGQIFLSKGLVTLLLITAVNALCFLVLGGEPLQALPLVLVGALGAMPVILISLVLGLAGRDQMTAGIFSIPILLIALAPMLGQYGDGIASVARLSPTGGMVELCGLLLRGQLFGTDAIVPLAVTAAWIALGFVVYASLFKRLIRDN